MAPTLLCLTGVRPPDTPFVGRDVSCLLARDCQEDNSAYLTSVYDDLIGLADPGGLWLYSFRRQSSRWAPLDVGEWTEAPGREVDARRLRKIFSFYLVSNALIEQDRVWPHPVH